MARNSRRETVSIASLPSLTLGQTDALAPASRQIQPLAASQYQSTPLSMSSPCGSGSSFFS